MLKTATIYRIGPDWAGDLSAIEQALATAQFVPCGATQQKSSGWVPPREDHGALAESVDGQIIMKLMGEQRIVPGAVVKRRADDIAEQMEKETGRKPGKKIMKELKEQALLELLPMAFTKRSATLVWIDRKAHLLVVDASSHAKSDEVITFLINCLEGLALSLVQTEMSPHVAMSHWLGTGEPPYQFTIDRECELKSTDEMKSVVKYGRHDLDIDEVRAHILAGKVPTKLAMTWRDRISFVLTDSMQLKKITFLDVVFEGKLAEAGKVEKGEAFDADAAIFTGEMSEMIPDLFEALGGEQVMGLGEGGAA
jgi:recombination associated protein RdgC